MWSDPWFWCLLTWIGVSYFERWARREKLKMAEARYKDLRETIEKADLVLDERIRILRALSALTPTGAWWKKDREVN